MVVCVWLLEGCVLVWDRAVAAAMSRVWKAAGKQEAVKSLKCLCFTDAALLRMNECVFTPEAYLVSSHFCVPRSACLSD